MGGGTVEGEGENGEELARGASERERVRGTAECRMRPFTQQEVQSTTTYWLRPVADMKCQLIETFDVYHFVLSAVHHSSKAPADQTSGSGG